MRKGKLAALTMLVFCLGLFVSGCSLFEPPPPDLQVDQWELKRERGLFDVLVSVKVVGEVTNVGWDKGDLDSCEVVAKFFDSTNVILYTNKAYYWDLNSGETAKFEIEAYNDDLSEIDHASVEASCS